MAKLLLIFLSILIETFTNPVMTRQGLLNIEKKSQFCSNLIHLNNFYYSLDEQKSINGIPADMSVHWKTGNIFYTLIDEDMKMSLQVLHSSGDSETIKVAGLGQSTCVDNLNDVVYLATDNGVYKYKEDSSIELYAALGEDVMYIAVSNDGQTMYIATWPQNRVHKIINEGQKLESYTDIPNGHGLRVDTRNNIFFWASNAPYVLKNGNNVPVNIIGLPNERMPGVFVSRSDEIFAMDENSNLYSIDAENASAKRLGSFNISNVNAFGLDSADNIVIGVKGKILKFSAYERNPCSEFQKQEKKGKRHSRKRKVKQTTTSTTETNEEDE